MNHVERFGAVMDHQSNRIELDWNSLTVILSPQCIPGKRINRSTNAPSIGALLFCLLDIVTVSQIGPVYGGAGHLLVEHSRKMHMNRLPFSILLHQEYARSAAITMYFPCFFLRREREITGYDCRVSVVKLDLFILLMIVHVLKCCGSFNKTFPGSCIVAQW